MKLFHILLFAGIFVMLGMAVPVLAEEGTPDEERIEHYAVDLPETKEAALALLADKVLATKEIVQKEVLTGSDLEAVHEISYSLEAAVDKLIALAKGSSAGLDQLDEAVQAIHYASENHEEVKTREWFIKLESASFLVQEGDMTVSAEKRDFYKIVIKDHKFTPEELIVPAGMKIKLKVHNQDVTPEEFESHDLNREKIIKGNKTATIFVGPLKPGKYHYFGEFNMDTANGYIIAQ